MRYWETRKKGMCFNSCDNQFQQQDVNQILWMQFNKDDDNGIKNNILEIYMTRLPKRSATKEQIVWSTQTCHSNHRYNTHT